MINLKYNKIEHTVKELKINELEDFYLLASTKDGRTVLVAYLVNNEPNKQVVVFQKWNYEDLSCSFKCTSLSSFLYIHDDLINVKLISKNEYIKKSKKWLKVLNDSFDENISISKEAVTTFEVNDGVSLDSIDETSPSDEVVIPVDEEANKEVVQLFDEQGSNISFAEQRKIEYEKSKSNPLASDIENLDDLKCQIDNISTLEGNDV